MAQKAFYFTFFKYQKLMKHTLSLLKTKRQEKALSAQSLGILDTTQLYQGKKAVAFW